jgi:hypothetical protein
MTNELLTITVVTVGNLDSARVVAPNGRSISVERRTYVRSGTRITVSCDLGVDQTLNFSVPDAGATNYLIPTSAFNDCRDIRYFSP